MDTYVDPKWRKHAERSGLPVVLSKRRIEKCSLKDAWYKDMVGQVVGVYYMSTFGAWTPDGRIICYYDLSIELNAGYYDEPKKKEAGTSFLKRLFK